MSITSCVTLIAHMTAPEKCATLTGMYTCHLVAMETNESSLDVSCMTNQTYFVCQYLIRCYIRL